LSWCVAMSDVTDHVDYVRAGEGDLADLVALRYRWRVEEAGEQSEGIDRFQSQFQTWYEAHRATHVGYLARTEGNAIGCAWLFVLDRIPGPDKFVRRAGMLQSVYVAPSRRNHGVGDGLIRRVIEDAKEREVDYLMVHPSSASFPFYRRLGFAESGRVLELRFV
jgi:GNAT superfamily N-acetyltransferase